MPQEAMYYIYDIIIIFPPITVLVLHNMQLAMYIAR